jgi:DNA-binding GntR family transcriptional regulator
MAELFGDTHLVPEPVRNKVYEALKDAILRGTLPPGQRMVEAQLAEMLNVSRTPLREAILKLESDGLVRRLSSGGAQVRPISADEIRELYAIREVLEGLAVRDAATRINEAQLERLAQLARELEEIEHGGAVQRIAVLGEQFHQVILEASGNRQLAVHLRLLRDQIQRYRYLTIQVAGRGRAAAKEHAALLAVLRRRDPDQAERSMRRHVQHAWRSMIGRLREVNLDATDAPANRVGGSKR